MNCAIWLAGGVACIVGATAYIVVGSLWLDRRFPRPPRPFTDIRDDEAVLFAVLLWPLVMLIAWAFGVPRRIVAWRARRRLLAFKGPRAWVVRR